MGAMQVLKEYQIEIPAEVGIIGFANESFGSLVSPSLSTIDQQTTKMGEETALMFLKQLKEPAHTSPSKIILEPVLIVRESSARLK